MANLADIQNVATGTVSVYGDGNLPRGYHVSVAHVNDAISAYVLKGDEVIGRIELAEEPTYQIRGSIQFLLAPSMGIVYHGRELDGGTLIGQMTDVPAAFAGIIESAVAIPA